MELVLFMMQFIIVLEFYVNLKSVKGQILEPELSH